MQEIGDFNDKFTKSTCQLRHKSQNWQRRKIKFTAHNSCSIYARVIKGASSLVIPVYHTLLTVRLQEE
jgi:hypothetical protein